MFGGHFSNISQAILQQGNLVAYDPGSGQNFLLGVGDPVTVNGPSVSFYGPTVALTHDNALGGWVGPFAGSRWRVEGDPSFGAWQFTQGLVDWRRYFFAPPVDRKSTRLNSSHLVISYAVFCFKKKN